jgi:VWFA-related protein
MKFSNRLVTLVAISTLIALKPSTAQDNQKISGSQSEVIQSDKVLRSNTRLVVVDVVASDGNGQPLNDLKPDDFSLEENGRPQKISNFTFRGPAGKKIDPPALPTNVITNVPAFQASTLNVILLDTLNGDFAEMAYVKDQLDKFLSTAQLDRAVALFAMEERLYLLQDITTDCSAL